MESKDTFLISETWLRKVSVFILPLMILLILGAGLYFFVGILKKGSAVPKQSESEYSQTEILVKFKSSAFKDKNFSNNVRQFNQAKSEKLKSVFNRETAKYKKSFDRLGLDRVYKIDLKPGQKVKELVSTYEKSGYVEYASPNYKLRYSATPDDPMYEDQWHLPQVDAPAAWDNGPGNPNIIIAVEDSGVDWNHPDLAANIWNNSDEVLDGTDTDGNGYKDDIRGWDFYGEDNNPMDELGHGTHVAGIASAVTNNAVGVAGMAWNVMIMPLRGYYLDEATEGIQYAVDNEADVINASWTVFNDYEYLRNIINYARDGGVIFVAASGNDNWEDPLYPAVYNGVMAIAATNSSDQRASFSNYGSWMSISAPGVSIYSTDWDDTYKDPPGSGTSYSSPLVAGIAALLKSQHPTWSYERLYARTRNRADNIDAQNPNYLNKLGSGRINAEKVVLGIDNTHPDGTLVQASGDPAIYYLDGGKRHIPNPPVFEANFRWEDIVSISTSERDSYINGPQYMYPDRILIMGSGPAVYVLEYHAKRHITSPSVFNGLGYNWSNIIVVSDTELNRYSQGLDLSSTTTHPSGTLVQASGDPKVYLIDNGRKHHIPSPQIFLSMFKWWDITTITALPSPTGSNIKFPDGTLIMGSSPAVYIVEYGEKRHISSPALFNSLNYKWSNIITIDDSDLPNYPDGPDLS